MAGGLLRQVLGTDELAPAQPADHPRHVAAMAATLTRDVFSHDDWIFERKLDGIRCLAHRDGDAVHLWSRNDKDLGGRFPQIVEAIASQRTDDFVLDGEVVTFDGDVTSFAKLQQGAGQLFFYAFDVVHADGHDLRPLPLRDRKRALKGLVDFVDPIRFTPHRNADGQAMYEEACQSGWEGVIAKEASSTYTGSRSKKWLKFKCEAGQELVIGGWTEPTGSRRHLGALLLGHFDGDELVYAGKVGTGFSRQTLAGLAAKLDRRARKTSPFDRGSLPRKGVHWVTPDLVCQVAFTEWTDDGRLRHPRYLGLREDKAARDVVRERPSA